MHILFANLNCNVGGFTSYSINMSKALRKLGHNTTALVCSQSGDLLDDFKSSFDNVVIAMRMIETAPAYVMRIVRVVDGLKPDVIINNTVPFVQAALPYLSHHAQVISVMHSIGKNEIGIGTSNLEFVDHLVSVSDNVTNQILGAVGADVEMIPVGVECLESARPPKNGFDPVKLLFVGRLAPVKNFPTIFKILEVLHQRNIDYILTVVGSGPEKDEIMRLKNSLPNPEAVRLLGSLPPSDIISQYASHDILLLPSIYEGTPHVVLEAMAHGVIPICSHIPGSTDCIISNRVNGFICQTFDVEAYADAVEAVISSPELYRDILINMAGFVKNNFDIGLVAKRYLALILQQKNRSPIPQGRPLHDISDLPPALAIHFPRHLRLLRHLLCNLYRHYSSASA